MRPLRGLTRLCRINGDNPTKVALWGSTPEPPKFPLPQFQPGNQRIQGAVWISKIIVR